MQSVLHRRFFTRPAEAFCMLIRRRIRTPLMGFPKTAPQSFSIPLVHSHQRHSPEGSFRWFRLQTATSGARSVLAIPPGFDGLLQAVLRGLVASRSRPWGSPRFRSSPPVVAFAAYARDAHEPARRLVRRRSLRPTRRSVPRPERAALLTAVIPKDLACEPPNSRAREHWYPVSPAA